MDFVFKTESDEPAPSRITPVDDRLTASEALMKVRRGEWLEYGGDFHNAKQLVQAMARRLPEPRAKGSPLEVFRAERRARHLEHDTLSRVLVALDGEYKLQLKRAPDVATVCKQVWGAPQGPRTLVALKTLLGMMGAAQWREKKLSVRGLTGELEPHYGVFTPTRTEYLELLPNASWVQGKTVFDIGTGTGVLSLLMLQRGAAKVVATDIEPRAVVNARVNAQRLGVAAKFTAVEADLFPEGKADLVMCNPPWIPETPKNRIDRAVFDDGGQMTSRFLHGLREHLYPGGRGLLLLSDLAVLLGLRPAEWVDQQFESAGLVVESKRSTEASHPRAQEKADVLHAVRSKEVTSVYLLAAK